MFAFDTVDVRSVTLFFIQMSGGRLRCSQQISIGAAKYYEHRLLIPGK
jgi:hypothetical protein